MHQGGNPLKKVFPAGKFADWSKIWKCHFFLPSIIGSKVDISVQRRSSPSEDIYPKKNHNLIEKMGEGEDERPANFDEILEVSGLDAEQVSTKEGTDKTAWDY